MYAVFRSGGKQYRATQGERLKLERLDAEEGAEISFDEVLLIGEGSDVKVGNPTLSGGNVTAKVVQQGKSRKVGVVKFRRRQNYLRQGSHRQFFTEVEITGIGTDGAPAGAKVVAKKAAKKPAAKKPAAEKVAKKVAKKAAPADKPAAKKKAAKKKVAKKKVTKKTSS
jgi:large subunit ribosomal protein L21